MPFSSHIAFLFGDETHELNSSLRDIGRSRCIIQAFVASTKRYIHFESPLKGVFLMRINALYPKLNCLEVTSDAIYVRLNALCIIYNCRFVTGGLLGCPLRCADDPLKRLCQMNASLSNSSISFSVHCFVGRLCRNIMISWKSMLTSFADHLTRNAAQT